MAQSEIIFSVEESTEGGYQAHGLGHAIFTQADSKEELKAMLRDAWPVTSPRTPNRR